ncbi:hypothetical protein AVEN_270917-1 [Araneus ventricosus]|uniref:Uncharacterized protein n=1 Tax=Araneus ventricosus TaxID=182803 RepID=A0A4Y2R8E0_ARAVE|nr:hypothetical protein AVEN_270917-1 [Araneus ventricosus]
MYHPSNGSPRTANTWGYFAVHEKQEANRPATASHGELPRLPSREGRKKQKLKKETRKESRHYDEDLSTGYAILIVGIVLSHCKVIKGKKSQKWRPTKQDAIDGLLLVLKSSADLNNTIDLKQTEFSKHSTPLQPTSIVVLEGTPHPFQGLHSEYSTIKTFESEGTFIAPETCVIGEHLFSSNSPTHSIRPNELTAQFLPRRSMLKTLLEQPNVLHKILDFHAYIQRNSNVLLNLMRGKVGVVSRPFHAVGKKLELS